jgi:hypothetical protein
MLAAHPRRRVFDLFRHPHFTLLFVPGGDLAGAVEVARALNTALRERDFARHVSLRAIAPEPPPGFDADHWAADLTGEFAAAYGLSGEGRIVLVRPDMYVALSCALADWERVPECLSQWFS